MFDEHWATNGLIDQAADLLHSWAEKQGVKGYKSEIVKLAGKTPLIFVEINPTNAADKETILMYGHLDKQPPMTDTWDAGLHPYKPVMKNGRLYGRGGADDGYALCAAVIAIKALQEQGIPHSRIVIMIEASEESGSPHLSAYVENLSARIGIPSLIVCLDSGAGNYEQLWATTTLRGLLAANLTVKVLREGVHSGMASGIVPSSFRIIRQILDRIEDPVTGHIKIPEFFSVVPAARVEQISRCAESLGQSVITNFPWHGQTKPVTDDVYQLLVNRSWMPTLSITGVDGIPAKEKAGNVLRTHTTLTLSIRLPPALDPEPAKAALKRICESNVPYGAEVTCDIFKVAAGWESPALADWVSASLDKASSFFFGQKANFIGEGGSIPFMGMLGQRFPKAQFVITGVLGPESNAHGPNEFLHVDFGSKITSCVSSIVADHHRHFNK